MDIEKCKTCKRYSMCEETGYLDYLQYRPEITKCDLLETIEKFSEIHMDDLLDTMEKEGMIEYPHVEGYIPPKDDQIDESSNTIELPINNTIFIKSISTTEGIYENARFTGTLEDFLVAINSSHVIPLYFSKEDKTVFINSIYIISFEY